MNSPISNIKAKWNSSAGLLRANSRLHKASHRHMTKSDAMGDKYGLTAESSTKDTQLSTRAGRRQCGSCVEMLFISSVDGVPGCGAT